MALTPFTTFNGDPDYNAVLEQTTLLGALYWNRQDAANQALTITGGGNVRAWQWDEQSWPPSWALLQQDNHLYVIIAGTTNWPQAYGDVVGCYAVQYGTFANFVHNFFFQVWQSIRTGLIANMPAGYETMPISFVGHSLGAAIAFLASVEWSQRFQAPVVEMMGLAQPKAFTSGYGGPLPSPAYFVSTLYDSISLLPPNSMMLSVLSALGGYENSIPMDWQHYTRGYQYDANSLLQLRPPSYWNQTPSAELLAGTAFYHPIAMYMVQAELAWATAVATGRNQPLLGVSRNIRSVPNAQTTNVNIDFRNYVDVQQQNQVIFRQQADGPLTPANLPAVNAISGGVLGATSAGAILPRITGGSSEMQKMTFFYHVNLAGYSESHLIPDPATDAAALALVTQYTTLRMACSGAQTTMDWIRLSTIGTARKVRVYTPFDLPAGTPTKGTFVIGAHNLPDQSDFGATSILLRKLATGGTFSHWFFRGVPDEVVDEGGLYDPAAGWNVPLLALGTFCNAQNFQWPGTAKETGTGHVITAMANNGIGQVQLTFTDNPFPGPNFGYRLRIRIAQQSTKPAMDGTWTVTAVDANTCVTKNVLWLPPTPVPTGRIWKMNQGGGTINRLSIERITERRVGRPFGLYRGRSAARV